jgi:hypothetical protein
MTGGVALWYWRYHSMDYSLWDDEEEAAGIAAAMRVDGGGVPAGIQFQDGRLIAAGEWPAYGAAQERREQYEAEWVPEPHPRRKITAPFGGGQIEIDAREPSWLGVTTRAEGEAGRESNPRTR